MVLKFLKGKYQIKQNSNNSNNYTNDRNNIIAITQNNATYAQYTNQIAHFQGVTLLQFEYFVALSSRKQ